jgi:hypothetical protein
MFSSISSTDTERRSILVIILKKKIKINFTFHEIIGYRSVNFNSNGGYVCIKFDPCLYHMYIRH